MKKFLSLLVLSLLTVGLSIAPAEAKRLGGGANVGKQRSSPAMNQAQKEAPRTPPQQTPPSQSAANPAAAAPAGAAAAAAAPKPSFMSRWGGVIAGVGAGALLASMFGGSLGGMGAAMGGLLNILIVAGLLYLAYRFFVSRRRPAAAGGMQFAGAGAGFASTGPSPALPRERVEPAASPSFRTEAAIAPGVQVPPGFEIEPFVRQAQTAFLRLQAANDAGDLADIRETSTPEVYAELAMQLRDRGAAPQKTEIVSLDANLLEVVTEGEYTTASLRYSGLVREAPDAPATPFDEVWHLRSAAGSVTGPWLIAGIQQLAA